MMVTMCPKNQEGSTFALFTTFLNISFPMSRIFGNVLSNMWDCSNRAMQMQDFSGLWNVIAMTTVISLLSLSLVQYLPRSSEEMMIMHAMGEKSEWHAKIFMVVLLVSLWVVLLDAFYELSVRGVHS